MSIDAQGSRGRYIRGAVRGTGAGVCVAFLMLSAGGPLRAQGAMQCHGMADQSMAATIPAVSPDKLPPPLKLDGIGNSHIRITASKAETQMWFDQGLNLLHDFWDYESARAFEQAVRTDAQCAMCYWGLYQAESSRGTSGKEMAKAALDKAVSLKEKTGAGERLFIEAAVEQQAASKDEGQPDTIREVAIWRKLVELEPRSTQARIFLANALRDGYDDDGKPRKGMQEARTILQGVLKDEPEDSAANHYWIHAVEAGPHPEEALQSASILAKLAPRSGHMVHMPGHIYYRTGNYAQAAVSFAASTNVDEGYMQAQHVGVDDDWNYVHNLMYAIANKMEQGHLKDATTLSGKLTGARGQSENSLYPWSARDSISRLNPELPVALRTGDWALTLKLLDITTAGVSPAASLTSNSQASPNLVFLARTLGLFARGMQSVEQKELAKAEALSTEFDAGLWHLSQSTRDKESAESKQKKSEEVHKDVVMPDALPKPLVSNLSIMSLELRAGIAMAKNDTAAAKKLYADAIQEEKELGYHEPPAFIRPVAESQAAMLMNTGAWEEAKAAYRKALAERPNSGFPLYGIARASEDSGDAAAATTEYATFVAAWADADAELPQVAHAREFLAQHQGTLARR